MDTVLTQAYVRQIAEQGRRLRPDSRGREDGIARPYRSWQATEEFGKRGEGVPRAENRGGLLDVEQLLTAEREREGRRENRSLEPHDLPDRAVEQLAQLLGTDAVPEGTQPLAANLDVHDVAGADTDPADGL